MQGPDVWNRAAGAQRKPPSAGLQRYTPIVAKRYLSNPDEGRGHQVHMLAAEFETASVIDQALHAGLIDDSQSHPVEERNESPARQKPANEGDAGHQAADQDVGQAGMVSSDQRPETKA